MHLISDFFFLQSEKQELWAEVSLSFSLITGTDASQGALLPGNAVTLIRLYLRVTEHASGRFVPSADSAKRTWACFPFGNSPHLSLKHGCAETRDTTQLDRPATLQKVSLWLLLACPVSEELRCLLPPP